MGILANSQVEKGRTIPPAKPGLTLVHLPDLSRLETEVKQQLQSPEDSLRALVKQQNATDETLAEAYGEMGELYHAYSLNGPARECYSNAIRLAPKDFRSVYLLAKLDQQEGRAEAAIKGFQSAASLRPNYVAVHVNLGNIYLELNRLKKAAASFVVALKHEENSAAAYYGLGQVAHSTRNYRQAIDHLEKALSIAPQANRIHYSLAMANRGLKNSEKARSHLAQQGPVGVRVADPLVDRLQELIAGERVHMICGRAALEAKRYQEAAEEFRKAVAANPQSSAARVNLGATLTQTGDLKGAAEQFERTLSIDPNNTSAHYNLGVLLANDNKHSEAVVHLQAVSRINPDDLGARFLLAQELVKSSRGDEALKQFADIVQADPNNEAALLEMVKLLQQKGRHHEALQALEKGHGRYPQKGNTAVMLASVLAASPQLDLRDAARALKLAQLAYEATGSLNHGTLVAMALAELGRCAEAASQIRKMLALAEKQRNGNLVEQLKAHLTLYSKEPCRPTGFSPCVP